MNETIRAAFQHYDEDGNGTMDINELENLIEDLGGLALESDALQQAIETLDSDKSGKIDLKEFETWWTNQTGDLDGDGKMGELEKALEKLKLLGQERFHVDIHTACWNGHLDVVERLLEDPENATEPDMTEFGEKNTPLHYAAYNGHVEVCKLLLKHRASINAVNQAGCTALFLAAQQNNDKIVELLLKSGADARIRDKEHALSALDVSTTPQVLDAFKQKGGKKPMTPLPPTLSNSTYKTMQIDWVSPPSSGQTVPLSGYKVKLFSGDKQPILKLTKAVPTTLVVGNLEADREYCAQVSAININGCGEYSEVSNAFRTTLPPPKAPEALTEVNVDKDMVEISWVFENESNPDYFVIQMITRKDIPWETVAKADGKKRSVRVDDLFCGKKYKFRIAGRNQYGLGQYSEPLLIQTLETSKRKFQRNANKLKAMTSLIAGGGLNSTMNLLKVNKPVVESKSISSLTNIARARTADESTTLLSSNKKIVPPSEEKCSFNGEDKKQQEIKVEVDAESKTTLSTSPSAKDVNISSNTEPRDSRIAEAKEALQPKSAEQPEIKTSRPPEHHTNEPSNIEPPKSRITETKETQNRVQPKTVAEPPKLSETKQVVAPRPPKNNSNKPPRSKHEKKIKPTKAKVSDTKKENHISNASKVAEAKPVPIVEPEPSKHRDEDEVPVAAPPSRLERVTSNSRLIENDESDDSDDFAYYNSDDS